MKTLKVCFMLDCTSSMEMCMQVCKKEIINTLEKISNEYKDYTVNAALLGYRDYGEKTHRIDFTDNHQSIYNELSYIDALGGNDQAEDVAGAYNWINALVWDGDKNMVFHITDAPEHGLKFHDNTVTDEYINGNPLIDLLEEIEILANNNVDLTVFRLNKSTNIMYYWMNRIYTEINKSEFKIIKFMDLQPRLN